MPQFRLFSDAGNLCGEGEIDSFAAAELPVYLDALPPKTGIVIDLATAALASRSTLTRLERLAESGVPVIIRGDATALSDLMASAPRAIDYEVVRPASDSQEVSRMLGLGHDSH